MLKRAIQTNEARYLVVGAACALANNAILIGGDAAGLHYTVCILLTFIFVLPLSYLIHAHWSFRAPISWLAFGSFAGGSIVSLFVASAAVGLYRGALEMPMILAGPLATVTMTIYNYLMTRWAVTREVKPGAQTTL